jgi:hypothetical protein
MGRYPQDALRFVSAEPLRHFERLAHGLPDRLGVHAVRECLIHRSISQGGQNIVFSDTLGIDLAELRPHPLPELGQPHPRQGNRTAAAAQPQPVTRGLSAAVR